MPAPALVAGGGSRLLLAPRRRIHHHPRKDPHMTTNDDMTTPEAMSAVDQARDLLERIQKSREDQPARLTQAREAADEARGWALIEEPWDDQVTVVPTHNGAGGRTGGSLAIPNITAKELFGSRLCFDVLDCGDDDDRVDEVMARYFTMVHGDTGLAFLLFSSALRTMANLVVPRLLEDIER
jgi:hypothetical protein